VTVYINPGFTEERIREELFAGSLIVLTELPSVAELVQHTRNELTELFAPHDPEHVHEHWDPQLMAERLGVWKPSFIHSERAGELVRRILSEAGMPPEYTYFDLPKPRTSFPQGHLNTGIAFAFPWHRDAWYSAPPQQLNWWMPVYPARPDNAMSFDPTGFGAEVDNDSESYDYYRHNASRKDTASQVTTEVQARPGAGGHHAPAEVVVLPPPGGILLFSGAQLHTSIPNTSGVARYSIDFRSVDVRDVRDRRGAPVVDARCTGTSIRDFKHVHTDESIDEELVRDVFGAPPEGAMLVYEPAG
jgi:hypothetical protein